MLWVAWWLRGCRDTTVKGISVEWRIVVPLAGLVFVVLLVSWGYRLNPDLTSWLQPQPVLSLVGLVVGFLLLGWQLDRQYENTLAANRRQAQERIKVELYGRIAERIEATTAPFAEVGLLPTSFVGELIVRQSFVAAGREIPKSGYLPRLRAQQAAASRSITSLMSVLETHAIVMPAFLVFRERLAEAHRRMRVACGDFHQAAIPFAGSMDAGPLRWPPSSDESQILSNLPSSVMGSVFNVTGVVWDLRVEAQNYLLGDLFGRTVPPRAPGDPTEVVTRIGQVEPDRSKDMRHERGAGR